MPDVETVFAAVDAGNLRELAEFYAEDAVMVFGNGEPLVGRAAVIAGGEAFRASVKGVRHRIRGAWTVDGTTITEADVTYTRLDDKEVTVPVVSIWEVNADGLIARYQVYVDLAPVYH